MSLQHTSFAKNEASLKEEAAALVSSKFNSIIISISIIA